MHASNVQVFAIDSMLEGVKGSRKSKKMKIKRKSKRWRRQHSGRSSGRSRKSSSAKSTPRKSPPILIMTDGMSIAANLPGLEDWPLSCEPWLGSPKSDVPPISENLASDVMALSEVRETLAPPMKTLELFRVQSEESDARVQVSEEKGALPPLSNVDVNRIQAERDAVVHPATAGFSEPAEMAVKKEDPQIVDDSREEKTPVLITEDEKALVSQEEEQKSIVYPIIVRPNLQTRPEFTSDTIFISEKGGEQILKILPTAKERAVVLEGEPTIIRHCEREKQNANISETAQSVGVINKPYKTETDGLLEPSNEIHTQKFDLLNNVEHNDHQDIESVDRVDDIFGLNLSLMEIPPDFETGDLGPSPRTINVLDGVWQKSSARNSSIALNNTEIKMRLAKKEMPTRDDINATARTQDTDSLNNEICTKTKSTDLVIESDQKNRDQISLLMRKMNESRVKKAVRMINSKVKAVTKDESNPNLSNIKEPDSLTNDLASQSLDNIKKTKPQMKYLNSIKRMSSNPINTLPRKSRVTAATKPGGGLKKRSSRPRLKAKREYWRQRHPTTDLKIGRSNTTSDKVNYDQKDKEKTFSSPRKPRLKAADIQEAKLKAARELASKQSYPYGPNAAKKIKQYKF